MSHEKDLAAPDALRRRLGEPPPPGALEERVVRTLRDRGVLAATEGAAARPRGARLAWRAAVAGALAASFLLGAALGTRRERARAVAAADARTGQRFALLLYRAPAAAGHPGVTHEALAAEYGAWARELSARGHAVSGEALGENAWTIDPAAGGAARSDGDARPALVGFFLLSARDAEEARALARSCPHVRRGGAVVVRPISPT